MQSRGGQRFCWKKAPQRIDELIAWGKHHGTKLVFGLESAHSRHRSLHAEGESTGEKSCELLYAKAHSLKHISIAPFAFSTGLLTDARARHRRFAAR